MIGVVISRESNTAFPPTYNMRRITGSSTTSHTEQQLKSYLELNNYRRIQKDKTYSWDKYAGLWVTDTTTSDGNDAEAISTFMRRTEDPVD